MFESLSKKTTQNNFAALTHTFLELLPKMIVQVGLTFVNDTVVCITCDYHEFRLLLDCTKDHPFPIERITNSYVIILPRGTPVHETLQCLPSDFKLLLVLTSQGDWIVGPMEDSLENLINRIVNSRFRYYPSKVLLKPRYALLGVVNVLG